METKFLVFPCPLTSGDIVILKDTFESLTDLILRLDKITELKPKFDKVRLPLVAMDLKEILHSSNYAGYRYNSYCLNMIIVKLAYHLSVLESAGSFMLDEIIIDCKSIMTTISAILQAKYYEWQEVCA